MFPNRNVSRAERWGRALLGLALIAAAVALAGPLWLRALGAASGAGLLLSGLLGHCPARACAARQSGGSRP